MRRILSLPVLAMAVWLSCLGFIGLLGIMYAVGAWHPHFLPLTTMLALVVVAGLTLFGVASWRIVREPGRRAAVSWLLLGSVPLWFLVGFFLYGLAVGNGRTIPLTLAIKLMGPLAESLMDLDARFHYPQRTVGEKVVMISAPMPEDAARVQVAAMDRHVRALEERLGRTTGGTIHWVRGPILGISRHAIIGLCLGSRPGEDPVDAEGLATVDRHEVAHCVLTSHCSAGFDPPAVLTEGWAEANQGADPAEQAAQAWYQRIRGDEWSLRELTAPEWYDRHEGPAYVLGAPLIHYLLNTYGPARFLELYATCTQSTFAADCRRVLGRDLDELDAGLRADIDRLAGRLRSPEGRLRRLATGPKVAHADWQAFLDRYLPEAQRLAQPARNLRLTAEHHYRRTDPDGKSTTFTERLDSRQTGDWRSLHARSSEGEVVYLARPRSSFFARRKRPGEAWELRTSSRIADERDYRRRLREIDQREPWTGMAAGLLTVIEEMADRADLSAIAVVELTPFVEEGRRFVRVRLEDQTPRGTLWHRDTFVLAADDHFAVRSEEMELSVGMTLTRKLAYDRHGEWPVLRSIRNHGLKTDGTRTTSGFTVLDRRFEPSPEAEFTREHLLAGAQVRTIAEPDPYSEEPSALMRWYRMPPAVGVVCLLLGAGLLAASSHTGRRLGG